MLTYNDIVKADGFLTEEGKTLVDEKFMPVVNEILSVMHSENEIRIMQSILSNLLGKAATNLIQRQHDEVELLNEMTDEQFSEHLKSKYKDFDFLTTPMTVAEVRRCQVKLHKTLADLVTLNLDKSSNKHITDPFEWDAGKETETSSLLDDFLSYEIKKNKSK